MSEGKTNQQIYALLVGVGYYEEIGMGNLPTYNTDLKVFREALISGLKVPEGNIRLQSGKEEDGTVSTVELARAMAGFKSLLSDNDTFLFYYSGHGDGKNIIFSNGILELQSLINYLDTLPVKNKIVILDCCFAGNFRTAGAKKFGFGDTVSDFAGHGIAVLASSAANETARLGPGGYHSMFTGALSTAILSRRGMRKGVLSINDIFEETRYLVNIWNKENPGKEQHPIFRSSMGGTIFFPIDEYQPYKQKEICYETRDYQVIRVKPLSTGRIKRLCAFIIPKGNGDIDMSDLPRYTKEIAAKIKYKDVYSSARSEVLHKGEPARAIWCYFSCDNNDIINGLHYAYTIWADDEELRRLYFKPIRDAFISDGIYVWKNSSYGILKQMQHPTKDRKDFIDSYKSFLALIVTLSEQFIIDMQEVVNQEIPFEVMKEKYGSWIAEVKKTFYQLSEEDIAPADLHDWSEGILTLAGWVLDMSMVLEKITFRGSQIWLIESAIKHYYESLEKLKKLEKNI